MTASLSSPSVPPAGRLLYKYIPAIDSLRSYSWLTARADLLAGLTVATVAVPQAMAYAIAAGVPPEYGLYTAIVMTAVGALLDSSKQLINGPTNVISIAVLSALAPLPPAEKLQGAILLAFLVGAFQTAITLVRLGDLTRYISHSVVVGFTTGASALLVLDQTRNLLGWSARGNGHDHFLSRLFHTWVEGGLPHFPTAAVGVGAVGLLLLLRSIKRRLGWVLLPDLLLTVVLSAVVVALFRLDQAGVAVVGNIPAKLPTFALPRVSFEQVSLLSESALAIAALGLLEALSMAKHIAATSGQKLDPNQQCLSEGLANLAGSFFQCIPGSGSLTRSAINQQAGAASQWSGVWSAVAVAGITLLFAPLARYIPRSALAGLLMVSAWGMIDWRGLRFHLAATRYDAIIVATTALAAVVISVEFCVLIGILFSFVLAVPRAGRMTRTEFVVSRDGLVYERKEDEPIDEELLIFGLEGELFFGSSLALDEHLAYLERRITSTTRVMVLRVKRLKNPDAVGINEIDRFLRRMKARGLHMILAGVSAELQHGLRSAGTLDELGAEQVFSERKSRGSATAEAIRKAFAYLGREEADSSQKRSIPPALHYQI